MKIKTSLIFALALAAGAAGAENWVPVAGSSIRINADEVLYKKLDDGKDALVLHARLEGRPPGKVVLILNCSGTDVVFTTCVGDTCPGISQVWPVGSAAGNWKYSMCETYVE